ncbi:hypothetical protein B9J78_03985 [bacterium Unc6]|nr:hypothetical protein [bacterium Unc6]
MKRFILLVGIFLGLLLFLGRQIGAEPVDISLTVYNQNFGLVRDVRYLDLEKGLNVVRFSQIPVLIERESIHFRSLTHPGSVWIQEQDFEYDLISVSRLLQKYLKQEIQILDEKNRLYLGQLLSYSDREIILRRKDGAITVVERGNISSMEFPALPEDLVDSPTLVWEIVNEKKGQHKAEVSYLTKGLNWTAEYKATISPQEEFLKLDALVTLNNTSGAAYNDAALKLVAGELRREKETPGIIREMAMMKMADMAALQFEQQQLFEYHTYTLPHRTTLENNQQKQILFLTSEDIPFEKIYTFETAKEHWRYDHRVESLRTPVEVTLQFKNDEKSRLGKPLPAGKVKVYQETESGLEFIGEDSILHTPESEEVKLYIGNAFDIMGEKKHIEHKKIAHNIFQNTYEISIRNHKKEKVTISVVERLGSDLEIISADHNYKKKDAFTVEFSMDIAPESSCSITYTVRNKIY